MTGLRREFASNSEITEAAEVFVASIGYVNARNLADNLRHVARHCDALKALDDALVQDFNVTRQEEIRMGQVR